jgi:hypothetical protein
MKGTTPMTSFRTTPWGPPGLITLCLVGAAAQAVTPAAVLPQAARLKAGEHLVFSVLAGPGETRPRATTTDMGRERAPLLGRPLSHRRERSCTIMGATRVETKSMAATAARKETSAPSPWLWSLWDEYGRPVKGGQVPVLYAVDGHAIRMINLRTREVTTLLGQVNDLGYQDAWVADAEDSTGALRKPILHAPWAIENADEFLIITDQGNHSVRIFWHLAEAPSLQTLAGHPWAPETRWGLLMDTIQGVGDESYGSLASPSGLAWDRARGSLLVANGSCLAAIDGIAETSLQPIKCTLRCPETVARGPFTVQFVARIPARKGEQPPVRPVQFTVDFYEADGTLAHRVELAGRSSEGKTKDHKTLGTFKAEGTFSKPGRAFVVLRCVTDQGHSDGALSYVTVQ